MEVTVLIKSEGSYKNRVNLFGIPVDNLIGYFSEAVQIRQQLFCLNTIITLLRICLMAFSRRNYVEP